MKVERDAGTRFASLVERTNRMIERSRLLGDGDPYIRAFEEDAERLVAINPSLGWLAKAIIRALVGDVPGIHAAYRQVQASGPADATVKLSYAIQLSNAGAFVATQEVFKDIGRPEQGYFAQLAPLALASGAFQTLASYASSLPATVDGDASLVRRCVGMAKSAADHLATHGYDDAKVGSLLDLAGEVMRQHRVMFSDKAPQVSIDPGRGKHVCLSYTVPTGAMEAAQMTFELACRVANLRNQFRNFPLLVSFVTRTLR